MTRDSAVTALGFAVGLLAAASVSAAFLGMPWTLRLVLAILAWACAGVIVMLLRPARGGE